MAKSGTSSSVVGKDSSRSAATRTKLVDAAIETLKAEGFAGSSARAIAERAGLNQGLIFYHFGSVANLLLAALDSVSARRMEQYGAAVDRVGSPDRARRRGDSDLPGGSRRRLRHRPGRDDRRGVVDPGLGAEVAARIGPWFAFAEQAIERHLGDRRWTRSVPAGDVAYGDRRPLPRARDAHATSTATAPGRSGSSPRPSNLAALLEAADAAHRPRGDP